jgi:coatomer subunit beta
MILRTLRTVLIQSFVFKKGFSHPFCILKSDLNIIPVLTVCNYDLQEADLEHGEEYKSLLIQAIHRCATRYAEVADSVVLALLDFLGGDGGYDVMQCVKSIVEQYPNFRPTIIRKIIDNLDEITSADAMRVALWLLGEYSDAKDVSTNETMLSDAFEAIRSLLGDPPFALLKDIEEGKKADDPTTITTTKNVVLADGMY